jgi:DNA (cytosine-5)-methyltransferase 1
LFCEAIVVINSQRDGTKIAIDLFCGCGGVTEGLKQAGFSVIAAVDNDPICCETYRTNHPEVILIQKDICETSARSLKAILGKRKLDLLVVCAPCQPFSRLNRSSKKDERVFLILQAIRFAKTLKPKHVFFENVPGLTKNSAIISTLKLEFEKLGYAMSDPQQVDAADYQVPQRRMRCVIIASKRRSVSIPRPVTPAGKRITVRDTIGGLPDAINSEANDDALHYCRFHSKITIERLRHISHDGGSRNELPDELVLPCHKKLDESGKMSYYSDVYGRMCWDDVAPTLTTGCTDVTKGRFAHPCYDRAITLREAAMLQTFPMKYRFCGNSSQISRQIGNAVPVNLVKNLAFIFA